MNFVYIFSVLTSWPWDNLSINWTFQCVVHPYSLSRFLSLFHPQTTDLETICPLNEPYYDQFLHFPSLTHRSLSPRQPTPSSPASPSLKSVLEENKESSTRLTGQAGESEAIPEDGDGKEAHLLENKENPQNVSIQSMSDFATSGPQRSSQSSQRRLQQQDAMKMDEVMPLESGDSA